MIDLNEKIRVFQAEIEHQKPKIIQKVKEALDTLPPFEGMRLEVDEQGIVYSIVADKVWWRVPIVPHPWPSRMYCFYEALAVIEEHLQDEQGLDILIITGDPARATAA